jgi:hypothetical protein
MAMTENRQARDDYLYEAGTILHAPEPVFTSATSSPMPCLVRLARDLLRLD